MSRSTSARTATNANADATDEGQLSSRSRHPSRDCECPACDEGNGGLQFCSKCRYNGCTAGKSLCGVGDDE